MFHSAIQKIKVTLLWTTMYLQIVQHNSKHSTLSIHHPLNTLGIHPTINCTCPIYKNFADICEKSH